MGWTSQRNITTYHEHFSIHRLALEIWGGKQYRVLIKVQRASTENPLDAEFDLSIEHSEHIHECTS
jgi:hypothetical protein